MPRPKYYCDYCDKTFFDVGDARRNHFESKQHKMLVKLYYDSLKDPSELLQDQFATPCKSFTETGTCKFGTNCYYSHSPLFFPFKEMLPLNDNIKLKRVVNGKPLPDDLPPSMMPPPSVGYDMSKYSSLDWGWKR